MWSRHLLVTLLLTVVAAVILVGNNDEVVGAVGVDFDTLEFAGRDFVLKQNIKFSISKALETLLAKDSRKSIDTVRAYLGFWETEVSPDETE